MLSSPVPETTEKVIGEETVNGIPDDVYVDRLFYPKPGEIEKVNMSGVQKRLWDIANVCHQIHLLMLCESGFVMNVRGHQVKLVLFSQNP